MTWANLVTTGLADGPADVGQRESGLVGGDRQVLYGGGGLQDLDVTGATGPGSGGQGAGEHRATRRAEQGGAGEARRQGTGVFLVKRLIRCRVILSLRVRSLDEFVERLVGRTQRVCL